LPLLSDPLDVSPLQVQGQPGGRLALRANPTDTSRVLFRTRTTEVVRAWFSTMRVLADVSILPVNG
jgi:hypothetical protein